MLLREQAAQLERGLSFPRPPLLPLHPHAGPSSVKPFVQEELDWKEQMS